VFLALFSSFTEGPLVDIIVLQDPPFSKGFLPGFTGFKSFAPPVARPKVACHFSQKGFTMFFCITNFLFRIRRFYGPGRVHTLRLLRLHLSWLQNKQCLCKAYQPAQPLGLTRDFLYHLRFPHLSRGQL